MRYQKIHSHIWNDEKFINLSPIQQRLFLYILTCPHGNIIGMFVLKSGYVCDDLKCLPKDFNKDLQKLIDNDLIGYDFSTSVILIKRFLKHNPITNPNQIKAAKKMLKELPKSKLYLEFKEVLPEVLKEEFSEVLLKPEDSVSVSDSVSVKKEEPAPKPWRSVPPKIEDVIAYCKERKNGIDPHKWYDHYKSNGWMVGKNKMVDWQAAVRTWEEKKEVKQKQPLVITHDHEPYDEKKVAQVQNIVSDLAKTF